MAKIYLIRHCESEGNATRRTQAQVDCLVTTKGYQQSEMLRRRFQGIEIDALYSSDAFRSIMTVEPIARERGLAIRARISLREITTGVWEDMAWGNIAKEFPAEYARWDGAPWDAITPGASTFEQVSDNLVFSLRRIAGEIGENGVVLAVSHSCTIKATLCKILGRPLSQVKELGHGDNTSVSLLNIDKEGNITLEYKNDASHLPPALQRAWGGVAGADINLAVYPCRLPTEEKALLDLARRDFIERGNEAAEFRAEEYLQGARRLLKEHPNYIGLSYLKDQACGYIRLGRDEYLPKDCCSIQSMYVLPELQGKGYGEQLFGYAAHTMRYGGMSELAMRKSGTEEEQRVLQRFVFHDMNGHPDYRRYDLYPPACPYPVLA